jgi:RimJ/RimL family protein N-acetyltransferase
MKLRPVTMADADFLLELKNDPEVRRWAIISHDEIKKENHLFWLRKKLLEDVRFFILVEGQDKLGDLRVEADREISVRIVEKFRGKGYASKALNSIAGSVYAKIVEGNIASMNLFTHNGFKFFDYREGVYYLKRP